MKKFLLLLLLLLSVNMAFVLLNGCMSCAHGGCGEYRNPVLIAVDNADSFMQLPSPDGVLAKAFMLVLVLEDTTYKCVQHTDPFPTNTAYALCYKTAPIEPLDSLSLISDRDFDAQHPAGTDLLDLFRIRDSGIYSGGHYIQYVHTGRNNFLLLHAPADTGTHTFTIMLFAHDSTKNLTATASPVKLLL